MPGCNKMTEQWVPTQFSAKPVPARCGSTGIRGDMVLCPECVENTPNPPAWTYEDAGDADFQPYREDMDYD